MEILTMSLIISVISIGQAFVSDLLSTLAIKVGKISPYIARTIIIVINLTVLPIVLDNIQKDYRYFYVFFLAYILGIFDGERTVETDKKKK